MGKKKKEVLKCPKCGSTVVATGQKGYSILTGFLGSGRTVNRCGICGYSWEPKMNKDYVKMIENLPKEQPITFSEAAKTVLFQENDGETHKPSKISIVIAVISIILFLLLIILNL